MRSPSDWFISRDLRTVVKRSCEAYPESEKHGRKVLRLLDSINARASFSFGTLLGIHRDKQLIPHDTDIDINVYCTEEEVKELREKTLNLMQNEGYTVLLTDTNQVAFSHPESVIIDICFFSERGEHYWCDHQVKPFIVSKEAAFDTVAFLEEIYGDWQTPKGKDEDYLA